MTAALSGHRVVVTRPAAQAAALVDALEAAGASVVAVPTIEIVPVVGAAAKVSSLAPDADWVVLTSVNALDSITGALGRVAVVGEATAAAARERGHHVALVAPDGTAASLVDALPSGTGRLLVVQASAAMPVVSEGLTAKGWHVDVVVAYTTRRARRLDHEMARIASATAAIFTSPSTVLGFIELYSRELVPDIVVAIGPSTVTACDASGIEVAVVARHRSPDGLVAALVEAVRP